MKEIDLEEVLRREKIEEKEKSLCDYCRNELKQGEYYQYSKGGGKYCDKKCFDMFTED